MAEKSTIPNYKEKQKLLYVDDTPDQQLGDIAEELLAQKRHSEAFDYLERMEDETKLKKFMTDAKNRGDLFNYERSARVLEIEVDHKEWAELASMVVHAGMIVNAVEALRRAGEKARARELIAANPDFFGPTLEMDRLAKPGVAEELEEEEEKKEAPKPEPKKIEPVVQATHETSTAPKDPDEEAAEAAARARKKKWKHKKK